METVKKFTEKQESSLKILTTLKDFLEFGKNEVGAKIETAMIKKVENAFLDVQSEKLKVALIGGFS